MSDFVRFLDRKFYPHTSDNWDDILFRAVISDCVTEQSVMLDLGAGAGIVEQMNFRGQAASVYGIDLDERVVANPYLDEGVIAGGEDIPYPDESFDIVFSDNVLEHLPDPESVFREVARVLKPGGKFLFKTPNAYHYMPLIARLTPHRFHAFINKLRGREHVDTFPTLYRANTSRRISSLARQAGITVESLQHIENRPEYMRIFAPLYLLGIAYERLVNSSRFLARLRILLIGVVSKRQ